MSASYLPGLMGGGSLNHSFPATHSFDDHNHNSSGHASSGASSHNAAALSHLLNHPSSPYTFDSTAASFLSKFVNRSPSDAITTASVIPVSPSSASASASSASVFPMPYQSNMSVASMRLKSGSSCHQCKTNKEPPHLYFCSTKQDTATGKRNCRKKYCVACMSRWYKQLGMTGLPGLLPPNGPGWSCPSCCGQCVCAACDRKKEKANRKAAEEEGGVEGAAADECIKSESEVSGSDKSDSAGGEVSLGVKRERSESSETDGARLSLSPVSKHAKMEISPPLNGVSASTANFSASDQKDRSPSPSTLVLPRPPPGYNRLQSEPNMPAFASPLQPMRTVTANTQIAQAIVAPLPPHGRPAQHTTQPRRTPAPFQVPALPLSSSSSSSASSSSSTPLFFDPMQEAAVRAISRYYHNQQQQQHNHQQQYQQHLQAGKAYPHATPATAYDHMRRVSDEVPSLTNFSSSNSSSVSTPVPNTPPTHFTAQEDAALAFALDSAPTAHLTSSAGAGGGVQLKALPAQPLPLLTTASRAITVPVTNGETDRHTAVRAIQSIGLLNFDIGGPSPPTLSLAASPSLSPVVSVPSSPRSLNAWRSSLSLASSSVHLASSFDALTSDPFHPSPLFNPLLPAVLGSTSSTNTPRNVGGQTPVQFWMKSGINSLCGTPRAGHLAATGGGGGGGRTHGSRGGSMGEMEFQALFN